MEQSSKNENRIFKMMMPYLLAFLGTVAIKGTLALDSTESIAYSNSFLSVMFFAGNIYVMKKLLPTYCNAEKRNKIIANVFSLFLSLALFLGAAMEAYDNVRVVSLGLWIGIVCFIPYFAPIVNALWEYFFVLTDATRIKKTAETKKLNGYQVWAIIFLLWLPTFLALYPGAFVYDAQDEYIEVISRAFNMHHPLLHVLLLGGIIHAAEYVGWTANTGIAIFVLCQMLILSGILTYSICVMEKKGVKKSYLAGAMLFYGLFPVFPLYAVCTAKDTLFTGFFMLVVIMLIEYGTSSFFTMKSMGLFVIASVLMMLMRNNGMYAYLVAIPVIFILTKEKKEASDIKDAKTKLAPYISLAILMLLSVALFMGCNSILKTVTRAEDSEHQEMLTVPIQQISRVYTYSKDTFSDEELKTLYEVLPEDYLSTYNLRISDVLKSGFNNNVYENSPAKYRSLWLKIGLRKPLIYLNAWLGTSYGYWYPDALNNVYRGNQMFTYQYGDSSYFGFETEPPGVRDSKFKVLELFYRNISLELFQQRVPAISMLFAPGFVFWIFAFIFVGLIRERRKNIVLIPVLLLWLTVLLGPTTIVRYVLILWFIIPLYPVLFYRSKVEA